MSRVSYVLLLACLVVAPAWAETCGSLPDREAARERLFSRLGAAQTEAEGRAAEQAIWEFWSDAPDARAQAILDRIHERRRWHDLEAALEAARALTAYCPAYAEGWNQTATVLFQMGRLDRALAAVEATLAREPKHFGALAGQALIFMRQDHIRRARRSLERAVTIHPWLKERAMLPPPPGEEL